VKKGVNGLKKGGSKKLNLGGWVVDTKEKKERGTFSPQGKRKEGFRNFVRAVGDTFSRKSTRMNIGG